jgi:Domain of unknown function (DUF1877)
MTKIMQYIRIRDDELTTLRALLADDPDGAYEFADELADGAGDDVPVERSRGLDTDKTWDATAFLLHRAGTVPVCVVHGGIPLTEDEWGYEPPRYLTPEQVSTAATDLEETPFDRLVEQFDPALMTDVYPGIWQSEGALDYLRAWYGRLAAFFRHAAAERDGMIIFLT